MILKTAERIHELRDTHKLTQSALAHRMGITRSSVNAWEMGISIPSIEKLIELADIFHTSTDYILGITSSEYIDLEKYNQSQKEIIYQLLNYFDSLQTKKDSDDQSPISEKQSLSHN